eukprot:TRINITY_DN12519_c0_g1_i1.p1 TRINITY_DN12519_c0_g1~~TRINITY_DN12519_c0_g1_i1.p1  ORF type:complete len:696 (+),score=167.74 TRINITY_DN12519_c0_g1_i1:119-2089(+)
MVKEAQEPGGVMRPAKLFIGGITKNTTTKHLRDHFAQFGRVLDCVAMRQPDGRPRGFGYVTLDSSAAADSVLAQAQVIDGRIVDMKRAVPEGNMSHAPTSRLHTPSGQSGRPSPAPLQATFGQWPESMMDPYAAYVTSPTGSLLPDADLDLAAWPWANPAVAAAAAAAASFAEATEYHMLFGSAGLHGPDCLELLSRNHSSPSLTAQWGLPETPTGGSANAMSAYAEEFVPARSALCEITNAKTAELPKAEVQRPGLVTKAEKELKIVIDDLENEQPSALNEPGAELSPLNAGPSVPEEDEDEENDEASEASDDESVDERLPAPEGPLPSLGSADHASGTCKRCNFFPKGRCQNGEKCTFCHLPHQKRKPSRQEKRERKAAWAAQAKEEQEPEMTFAYSVLPGLPPISTTKLPSPLALPGGDFFSGMQGASFPAPPPGLGLDSCQWQPDEEVSPMRSQVAPALLSTSPVLATVPVSPTASLPSPSAASIQATLTTPTSVNAASKMVTMATQTSEDEQETDNHQALSFSREELLKLRVLCGKGSAATLEQEAELLYDAANLVSEKDSIVDVEALPGVEKAASEEAPEDASASVEICRNPECKPCMWHKKSACVHGDQCNFCHLAHKSQRPRKHKRDAAKKRAEAARQNGDAQDEDSL